MKSPHSVYIGDSSSLKDFESLKRYVEDTKFDFRIFVYHIPELTAEQAIYFLAEKVKEAYVAFCGDDDFLVPSAICSCIEILEVNLDARIAQGKSIIFEVKGDSEYGIINSINDYINLTDNRSATGLERLKWFIENYFTPQFSIHRTSEFLEDMRNMNQLKDRSFTEYISNFLNIINGKSITIDSLYLIRQSHNARYLLPNKLDWLLSSFWNQSCKIFIDTLAEHLAKVDRIDKEMAEKLVKLEFSKFLGRSLNKKNNLKTDSIRKRVLDLFPAQKDFLKKAFYAIRYRTFGNVLFEFINFIEKSQSKLG